MRTRNYILFHSLTVSVLLLCWLQKEESHYSLGVMAFVSVSNIRNPSIWLTKKSDNGSKSIFWIPLYAETGTEDGINDDDKNIYSLKAAKQREQEILTSEAKRKLILEQKMRSKYVKPEVKVQEWRKKEEKMKDLKEQRPDVEIKRLKEQRDIDIKRLKEQREIDIKRLKFQLSGLQESVETTEKRAKETKEKYDELKRNSSAKESSDRDTIDELQKTFSREEELLQSQINKLKGDIIDSHNRFQKTESSFKKKETELKSEIDDLQGLIDKVNRQLSEASEKLMSQKKYFEQKLPMQQKDDDRKSKLFQSTMALDKRGLRNEAWDALNKLENVKYQLNVANREMKKYRSTSEALEKQAREMDQAFQEKLFELENRMEGDQTLFAKAEIAAKENLESVKADFRTKLLNQDQDSQEKLDRTTLEYEQNLKEMNDNLSLQMEEINRLKDDEIARIKAETAEQIKAQQNEYQIYKENSENTLLDEKARSERQVADVKIEMERKLEWVKKTSEIEKQKIVEEKDTAISSNRNEAIRQFIKMERQLTQKWKEESSAKKQANKDILQKNKQIMKYEGERKSFRKMAKLALNLAKGKSVNFVSRKRKNNS